MSWEAVDSPDIVLPRVLNVRAALTRVGFTLFVTKRATFYRMCVQLHNRIDPPIIQGTRKVSHVLFVAVLQADQGHGEHLRGCSVSASYGYPYNYTRKQKVVLEFKQLIGERTTGTYSFSHDSELVAFENAMLALVKNLQTSLIAVQRVSTWSRERHGYEDRVLAPHASLIRSVKLSLDGAKHPKATPETFFIQEETEAEPTGTWYPMLPEPAHRLPNFDRRRSIRSRIRRPF